MTEKRGENGLIIGIGANLPLDDGSTPLETCQAALRDLDGIAGLRVTARSHWYATAPMPPSGQPDYINGAAFLEGTADPAAVLASLHQIESRFGRRRSVANAARTIDLDLVAVGSLVRTGPDPIVPHPRMHERAFVLLPLLDVAPGWVHPVLLQDARALLDALPPQGVRRLGLRDDGSAIR